MTEKENRDMSRQLKSQMVLADLKYEHIGGATGRAWRYRISNPDRMTVGDLIYLLDRMNLKMTITN